MNEFRGKVAVITGAASGIGRALADRCAQEGMKIVLADIEEEALARTEQEMTAAGATILAVRTDVANFSDVEALAAQTLDAFGAVHLLCNNAGVGTGSPSIWENTLSDWKWLVGVNLWGVIHGVLAFVPIMLDQDTECHIVNTASIAGLTTGSIIGPYGVTKHAVVSLSESLHLQMEEREAKVKVAVLCPEMVNTRLWDADRNRPLRLQNPPDSIEPVPEEQRRKIFDTGITPDEVADRVFDAIRDDRFYILTHPETTPFVRLRMEDIVEGRNPQSAPFDL